MTARQQRRKERQKTITVVKTSLYSDRNNSFSSHLTPMQSWELVMRISRETWSIQNGQDFPERLDKTHVRILSGKKHVPNQ
jgi:hypothetical protein